MGRVTSLDELPLRDDLRGLTPYGAPQAPLPVALNVNENTHPVPDEVARAILDDIARSLRDVNRYPDREFTTLRESFAAFLGHGLTPDRIWAGNGSNEVLQHIMQAFAGPGRTAFGFAPTYSMYPLITQGTGARWIAGTRHDDFTVDPDEAARQVAETDPDVIILCTPNNPTGTPLGLDVIEAVYEAARGVVIVDEAYQEFARTRSALELLEVHPRLVVSRTMSKAFALAGGRVGYLAAHPAVVDACRIVRLPYHLSAQTQAVARVALRHREELLSRVHELADAARDFETWLRGRGYDVVDSEANFTLFGRFPDRHTVWQQLLDRGVLIRETGPDGFLRASAGTPAEMAALRDALDDISPAMHGEPPTPATPGETA